MSQNETTPLSDLIAFADNQRKDDDQRLKREWSGYIYKFVWATLIFQIFLTIAVGENFLSFEKYSYFLYAVIGENFFQVLGMGYIVANHLFPNNNYGKK